MAQRGARSPRSAAEQKLALQQVLSRVEALADITTSIVITPTSKQSDCETLPQWQYIKKVIGAVEDLSRIIENDETIMISVKNQKYLKCCFQSVTYLGILPNFIPGVGLDTKNRLKEALAGPPMKLKDTDKYKLLKLCTDFYINSYRIPVLKNIILTEHLVDYLAVLIQLTHAPLKKPGKYEDYVITEDMYRQLLSDRLEYLKVFENLVSTCFQPMLMKNLLLLQSRDPPPPIFLKKVISRELSKRMLVPGGLISLIRCFIECQTMDVGREWKKIYLICRIVCTKQCSLPEEVYLSNMCGQLKSIITSNNTHHYIVATACILHLQESHKQNKDVQVLAKRILNCFDYQYILGEEPLPGTVLLTPHEIEQKVNILLACFHTNHLNNPVKVLSLNIYILFLLRLKCSKSLELKDKLSQLTQKYLEEATEEDLREKMKLLVFGQNDGKVLKISIEEYDSGLTLKYVSDNLVHPIEEASKYFIAFCKKTSKAALPGTIFKIGLEILPVLAEQRKRTNRHLLSARDELEDIQKSDQTYAVALQMLEELSVLPSVVSLIKTHPECLISFIEGILLQEQLDGHDECITIALVLLNSILTESDDLEKMKKRWSQVLMKLSLDTSANAFLAKEGLEILSHAKVSKRTKKSAYEKALANVFDPLVPVKAHGLIELTKLLDQKDLETLSKKHYLLGLFQENLKDDDSFIYLSAVNGIAALGKHCTDNVLNMLSKEYRNAPSSAHTVETKEDTEKRLQMRMKVGDVLVKVTKTLGDMAAVHKGAILDTVLSCINDEEPFIRASALSNLAEICKVMNYKLGTSLYEILLCVYSIVETDPAVECRRASVLVISNLLIGVGHKTLVHIMDFVLPIYRTLRRLYANKDEDATVRLHAQIALEELHDIVKEFMLPQGNMSKQINIAGVKRPEIRFK